MGPLAGCWRSHPHKPVGEVTHARQLNHRMNSNHLESPDGLIETVVRMPVLGWAIMQNVHDPSGIEMAYRAWKKAQAFAATIYV